MRPLLAPLPATVTILSAGASPYLAESIEHVLCGTVRPARVEVIWSGVREGFPVLPAAVSVLMIPSTHFDHGTTRQLALDRCDTALQVFLSDDAVPASVAWLEELCKPFVDGSVLAVYGRHVPRANASSFERAFRHAKYPARDISIRRDLMRQIASGLAPVSDANAAYRAAGLRAIGGVPTPADFAEDVDVAIRALEAGWRLHYASSAEVWHSHDVSGPQVFSRGWKTAVGGRSARGEAAGGALGAAALLAWEMVRCGWRGQQLRGVFGVLSGLVPRAIGYGSGRVARWVKRPFPARQRVMADR